MTDFIIRKLNKTMTNVLGLLPNTRVTSSHLYRITTMGKLVAITHNTQAKLPTMPRDTTLLHITLNRLPLATSWHGTSLLPHCNHGVLLHAISLNRLLLFPNLAQHEVLPLSTSRDRVLLCPNFTYHNVGPAYNRWWYCATVFQLCIPWGTPHTPTHKQVY